MPRIFVFFILPAIIFTVVIGCSSQHPNPTTPGTANSLCAPNLPWTADSLSASPDHNRALWGTWDITLDPYSDRQVAGHLNVAALIPAPSMALKSYNSSTGIASVDITISNPYSISGFDVRLIVYTDSLGHKLTNADDWTSLFDIPGGLPINPFKAYAKTQPNRKFAGQTQYTENCRIYFPGGNWQFKIAIDASYPTNCAEPYELTNFMQGIILDQAGSSTEIEVTAHSWGNDVNSVRMYCPSITGTSLVTFHQVDSEKWGYTLVNNTVAASGNYTGYLLATTSKSGSLALYDEVTIKITPLNSGWARTWGGVGDDYGQDIAVDNDGNIYSTGSFAGTVDFNPDQGHEDIHTASGNGDAFLVKYDKYGNFLWAKTWGGAYTGAQDYGHAIDVDSNGYVFVAGGFFSTVDFGTNGTPDIRASKGYDDMYLCKYAPDGSYLWVKTWGGTGIDAAEKLTIDSSNNVLIVGYYSGTVDFDPSGSTDNHSSNGGFDIFISKFNNDGAFQWARTWGSNNTNGDYGEGIACDSLGNAYCSGYFGGTVDFNPGSGTDNHTSLGLEDVFLSKLDSNGNFLWAKTWGGGDSDEANECAVDENNDVYVVGDFKYTVDFNPDPAETDERTAILKSDVFVSKFESDGYFEWVLTWGGTGSDHGKTIETDNDFFWVGGDAPGFDIDFDPGIGDDVKNGGEFISEFDLNGNYILSRIWYPGNMTISGSDCDSLGKIYIAGSYSAGYNLDFDPGPDTWFPPNYIYGGDCYIMKILPNGLWE